MANSALTPGVVPARLSKGEYDANFADKAPPLTRHEAHVAADRCYFCFEAPCTAACPTEIDIALFIRQIATDTPEAAARTIFDQNILGGMCARVCPTEELCEEACVREAAEGRPVEIGRLQRHATDTVMARAGHPYARAAPTGRRVAVVGAGPAGLACAHRLAMHGHEVVVFEGRAKPGGLNEYGIAAYKTPDDFAQDEVAWLMRIGGIELAACQALGREVTLDGLRRDYDAVFLGVGLGGVNALDGDWGTANVADAVDFISELRQAGDLATLPVGRRVVVIGGGMTAVDVAVQSKLLGAESVTMVYRGGRDRMSASAHEQDLAASKGVTIVTGASPVRLVGETEVEAVEFAYTETPEESFRLPADQVFKAIGQSLEAAPETLAREGRRLAVTGAGRTSLDGVWAGGDCVAPGEDLTVTAVAQGRDAAQDIHATLTR